MGLELLPRVVVVGNGVVAAVMDVSVEGFVVVTVVVESVVVVVGMFVQVKGGVCIEAVEVFVALFEVVAFVMYVVIDGHCRGVRSRGVGKGARRSSRRRRRRKRRRRKRRSERRRVRAWGQQSRSDNADGIGNSR